MKINEKFLLFLDSTFACNLYKVFFDHSYIVFEVFDVFVPVFGWIDCYCVLVLDGLA